MLFGRGRQRDERRRELDGVLMKQVMKGRGAASEVYFRGGYSRKVHRGSRRGRKTWETFEGRWDGELAYDARSGEREGGTIRVTNGDRASESLLTSALTCHAAHRVVLKVLDMYSARKCGARDTCHRAKVAGGYIPIEWNYIMMTMS